MERISVARPKLAGNERRYVLDCLDTGWISSHGKYIGAFEEDVRTDFAASGMRSQPVTAPSPCTLRWLPWVSHPETRYSFLPSPISQPPMRCATAAPPRCWWMCAPAR